MRTPRIVAAARSAMEDHAAAARTTTTLASAGYDELAETLAEVRRAAGWVATLAVCASVIIVARFVLDAMHE